MARPENVYYERYQPLSVFSQLMFNIEPLSKDIPRSAFLPSVKNSVKSYWKPIMVRIGNRYSQLPYLFSVVRIQTSNCLNSF